MLWLYENRFASVGAAAELQDEPSTWSELLNNPTEANTDAEKENAYVVCGARYVEGAPNRDKEHVDMVECLVLDVDARPVPEEILRTALSEFRAIVYASPSHRAAEPRWRVLMPLAKPLPPKKHRGLVSLLAENLIPEYPGCIDVDATGDPCRLGFIHVTKCPEDYTWWECGGDEDRLDWSDLGVEIPDEDWMTGPLSGLERSARWTDRAVAYAAASRHFASRGYEETRDGEHRKLILWNVSMELWWDWAAEDEDFVMGILRDVNRQFTEPKEEEVLDIKMREAHKRTIGPHRKLQHRGPYGFKREPGNTITEPAIKHLAKRLRRSSRPHVARVGEELFALADGDPLAEVAEVAVYRAALGRCAVELATHFSNDTADRIFGFCLPSMNAMRSALGKKTNQAEVAELPTDAEVRTWIETRLKSEKSRKEDRLKQQDLESAKAISLATIGKRESKYSPEEWDGFQAVNGCGLTDHTVLLQSGRGTYVFLDGTWVGPYQEKEFDAQGYLDLEAASDFVKIKSFIEDPGTKQMRVVYTPLQQLLQKYGSFCNTRVDYMCDKAFYRAEDKTLVLPGPARNPLEPQFHVEVDTWLRRLTGRADPKDERVRTVEASTASETDDYDVMCNWMACLTQLDRICAALYLQGPKGVGKGLFADGVAKIWKAGAINPKAAFSHFNSLLLTSPFIHVNEGFPKESREMSTTELLRRVLVETEHVYTRKNVDSGKIYGAIRIVFTANNLKIFNSAANEDLQQEDVEALRDRFVHVKCQPEGGEYLRSLGPRHRDFVKCSMIAQHALWLTQHRWATIHARDHRFLVRGQNTNVANITAASVGATSEALTMLVEGLVTAKPVSWFVVKSGQVWVSGVEARRLFTPSAQARFSETAVARGLSSVSDRRQAIRSVQNKVVKMWRVKLDVLRDYCDDTHVQDWEDVEAGIAKLSKLADEVSTLNEARGVV